MVVQPLLQPSLEQEVLGEPPHLQGEQSALGLGRSDCEILSQPDPRMPLSSTLYWLVQILLMNIMFPQGLLQPQEGSEDSKRAK